MRLIRNHRPGISLLAAGVIAAAGLLSACIPPPTPTTTTTTIPGPVTIDEGHLDGPAAAFEDGAFDVHVHDEDGGTEYEPGDVIIKLKDEAETEVPAAPAYSFLGAVGSPLWVLPQVEDPNLLYLGYATEEIAAGVFDGNEVQLRLISVSGPGEFAAYTVGGFGVPTVLFDSDSGPLPQSIDVPVGTHAHANWAFSAPGTYTIEWEFAGTLAGGGPVSSGPVAFTYQVGS